MRNKLPGGILDGGRGRPLAEVLDEVVAERTGAEGSEAEVAIFEYDTRKMEMFNKMNLKDPASDFPVFVIILVFF